MMGFIADLDVVLLVLPDFNMKCIMGSFCYVWKNHNVLIIGLVPLTQYNGIFHTFMIYHLQTAKICY